MNDHDRVTDAYLNWRSPLPEPAIEATTTPLLIIDMQYAGEPMDAGIFAEKRERGLTAGLDYFAGRLAQIVPVIEQLGDTCQEVGIDVIFSRIQSMSLDACDRGGAHKNRHIFCPPGSRDALRTGKDRTLLPDDHRYLARPAAGTHAQRRRTGCDTPDNTELDSRPRDFLVEDCRHRIHVVVSRFRLFLTSTIDGLSSDPLDDLPEGK